MLVINVNYFQIKYFMISLPFWTQKGGSMSWLEASYQSPHSGKIPLWPQPKEKGQHTGALSTFHEPDLRSDIGWANQIHSRDTKFSELSPSNVRAPWWGVCVCVWAGGMNVHGFNLTSPHATLTVSQYPKSFQILLLLIIIISVFQTGETEAKSG